MSPLVLAPVPDESAPATKAREPPFSTMLLAPKGVLEVSVLRNSPAPSLVRTKLGLAMAVASVIRPPETTPIVEWLPRVTAPVMAPPVVAAPLTKAPSLLMPVPLIVSVPICSVPVWRKSKVPPELTVFAAALSMELVPAPVIKNLPPALMTIGDVTSRPLVTSIVPSLMVTVPPAPVVVFPIASVPVPVLVRAPFKVTPVVEVVKVAPLPTLIVVPAAMVIAPDQVVARFGSRMRAPPLLTPVPARDSSSKATVPPMPTRSAPPLLTTVPLPAPLAPRAVRLVTRRVPLLIFVVPV